MVARSCTAKRSVFNPIPWFIAVALLIGVFAVVTEAKAGSIDAAGFGRSLVDSPPSTPPSIGWVLEQTGATGTRITWTPKASGSYTINVVVGDSVGSATVWALGSEERTDVVSIFPVVDAEIVESANLIINEN